MRPLAIAAVGIALVTTLLAAHGSSVQAQPAASIALPAPGDTKQLYPGCNAIALTFPDGTASQTVIQAVSPAGAVEAIWRHNPAQQEFEAFSPAAPQASDLLTVNFLDPVWLCLAGAPPTTAPVPPPQPTRVPPPPIQEPPAPSVVSMWRSCTSAWARGAQLEYRPSFDLDRPLNVSEQQLWDRIVAYDQAYCQGIGAALVQEVGSSWCWGMLEAAAFLRNHEQTMRGFGVDTQKWHFFWRDLAETDGYISAAGC